jgi:hypothetical protein
LCRYVVCLRLSYVDCFKIASEGMSNIIPFFMLSALRNHCCVSWTALVSCGLNSLILFHLPIFPAALGARVYSASNRIEYQKLKSNDEEWCLLGCYAVWLL